MKPDQFTIWLECQAFPNQSAELLVKVAMDTFLVGLVDYYIYILIKERLSHKLYLKPCTSRWIYKNRPIGPELIWQKMLVVIRRRRLLHGLLRWTANNWLLIQLPLNKSVTNYWCNYWLVNSTLINSFLNYFWTSLNQILIRSLLILLLLWLTITIPITSSITK